MPPLNLGLVVHNHQPVGQHPWVFEAIYDESYLPMLRALEANPHVRLSLHYTGCLLDWVVPNRPEFVELLRKLVGRGQVELLTGGYYEPILVAIPESDALAQIDRLTSTLAATFDASPRGLWLAERVWEPHLPSILSRAGVEWTVLDDTHFKLSGLSEDDLRGYYVTEDRGAAVKLVATSKRLREMIPWRDVDEVIEFLRSQTGDDDALLVMGDDGEKFGSWPGTFDHVWTKGWMQRFFDALNANAEWLTTVPVGEYIASHPSRGRVYVPAASYEEMMEWALPPARSSELTRLRKKLVQEGDELGIAAFLGGGLWRNFMAKYSEVNVLHKKVLRVHEKLAALDKAYERGRQLSGTWPQPPASAHLPTQWQTMPPMKLDHLASRSGESPLSGAWEHLWASECNCPYWHGVFGGIYLRDIRHALFKHAIEAEVIADGLVHKGPWLEIASLDHDRDGVDELLIESESADVYLAPSRGGAIFEWDLKAPALNLATALRRRPEAYHETVRDTPSASSSTEEVESIHDAVTILDETIRDVLVYDWHERWCLVEHFLDPGLSIDEFAAGRYSDLGDFALEAFEWKQEGERSVVLEREGLVRTPEGETRLHLRKLVESDAEGRLSITYLLSHLAGPPLNCHFGSEWNLSPLLLGDDYSPAVHLNGGAVDWSAVARVETEQVAMLAASSPVLGLKLEAELRPAVTLWSVPVEAASASEKGYERTYQGHCLYFRWPLALAAGQTARFGVTWRPRSLDQ